jgi:zinc and cadmium transporter
MTINIIYICNGANIDMFDSLLTYILAFTVLGSIVSLIGGVLLLYWKKETVERSARYLVSFSIGTLLAAVFLDLFPESIEAAGTHIALIWAFGGLLLFFFLEKIMQWHYCHDFICKHKNRSNNPRPFSYLLIFADTIHNFIDGVLMAATFLISIPLGIVTSVAVFFHEIPQEIGDFAVLLYAKMERPKILIYNVVSACAALVGAIGTYFVADVLGGIVPLLAAFAGGGFLYIALVDLVPETHGHGNAIKLKETVMQIAMVLIGIFVIYGIGIILHTH